MGDAFAALIAFLTRDIDRRSARDWRLLLLAAVILAGAGAVLWRIPDPAELVSRRVPAMVCLGLGALFLAYAVFVYLRQRPAALPADAIAIGIARLHPVGGGRAKSLAEVEADKLYRQLSAKQKAGAPIQVRRVFASIPEAATDDDRAKSARDLGMQPNVRVHLLVWGDAAAEGRGRLYLNLAAAHPAPAAEFVDAPSEEYEALAAEYPDLSYADFILLRCGEALVAAKDDVRALAVTNPMQSVASAALRGEMHLRLSEYQPPEVCRYHLQRAITECERLTGADPDPVTFHPYGTQRGRSEWIACFARIQGACRLTYDRDAAEQVWTLLRLKNAYYMALRRAEREGDEIADPLLGWWEKYAQILIHLDSVDRSLSVELLNEAAQIREWVVRERARRRHSGDLLLTSATYLLQYTSYSIIQGSDDSAIDNADQCIRDIAAIISPFLAATLWDLANVEFDLYRLSYETAEQQRTDIQASILASERLTVDDRLCKNLFIKKAVLFTLACSYGKLAFSYPEGPDRRAGFMASVSAWQRWTQVPSQCSIRVDTEVIYLGRAYIHIAIDERSPPEDAVQFAMLAQQIFETILAHPAVGPRHNKRGPTHAYLSAALCVLARYSLNGRKSLLASAREHARRAADLGFATAEINDLIDTLSAESASARPAAAA